MTFRRRVIPVKLPATYVRMITIDEEDRENYTKKCIDDSKQNNMQNTA